LLGNVSAVRLYEECIKLFQNEYSFKVYEQLERYGLLKHLFKQTHKNDFIKNDTCLICLIIASSQACACAK
jgi:poly(A) polymerase